MLQASTDPQPPNNARGGGSISTTVPSHQPRHMAISGRKAKASASFGMFPWVRKPVGRRMFLWRSWDFGEFACLDVSRQALPGSI